MAAALRNRASPVAKLLLVLLVSSCWNQPVYSFSSGQGKNNAHHSKLMAKKQGDDSSSSNRHNNRHNDLNVNSDSASTPTKPQQPNEINNRRSLFTNIAATVVSAASAWTVVAATPAPALAEITKDAEWPLWPALPVAPYKRRRTIRQQVAKGVWTFDQLIGIYYVHVPIRMTVFADADSGGLFVYAPVAPTKECLALLQELIDEHGPITNIVLPSVAVEHKVNAGPFARKFPNAAFYATDRQYSFPVPLPASFLGLPSWTQSLPTDQPGLFGPNFDYAVLTVKPGIGSQFQDVAVLHKPSKTLAICDVVFAVTNTPPAILTQEPEYVRALLWHARDNKDDPAVVLDTVENREKGWRRIVLLFNFFFPGSGVGNLGIGPVLDALSTPFYENGWGGWKPFSWKESEVKDFQVFSDGGKPTILPIIQIILARGPDAVNAWVDTVQTWDFVRVIPAHLNSPLAIGPKEFGKPFEFARTGRNEVRFCDEDVAFLRAAEEGPLSFSVYKSDLGVLRGRNGNCGL